VTGNWAQGGERQIIEAVQSALVAALRIPDWDRDVVLDLYDEAARTTPTGKSERYTRVEIIMFAGRSIDAKRILYKTLVANLSNLGVPSDEIKIILIDVPSENWGLRGGFPASEIDLGFAIDV